MWIVTIFICKRINFGVHMKFLSWIKNTLKTGYVAVVTFNQSCFNCIQKFGKNTKISHLIIIFQSNKH